MKISLVALTLAVSALSPALAHADIIPGPGDCQGKSEGDACEDGSQAGSCGAITYTKTFTPPVPGAQPQTSTRSYFGCRVGVAPTKAASASATGSTTVAPENTDSIPTKNNETPTPAKKSSGFCSVRDVGARSAEDATLVMILAALAFVRRRSGTNRQAARSRAHD